MPIVSVLIPPYWLQWYLVAVLEALVVVLLVVATVLEAIAIVLVAVATVLEAFVVVFVTVVAMLVAPWKF